MRGGGDRQQKQSDTEALKGVEVGDIDQRARRQYNIPANIRGAVITNLDPESKAAEAGLQPGDVITEIERRKVNNAEEAIAILREHRATWLAANGRT